METGHTTESADEPEPELERIEFDVDATEVGARLDVVITARVPKISRSYAARLIKSSAILLDGEHVKAAHTVRAGQHVRIELPAPEIIEARPEDIPLDIFYEDHDMIVVNKPAGMVAHPSSGHTSGSLVNALLFHCHDLSTLNGSLRPGIVHRLDKDTTGLIVAAKNDLAHRGLAEQFAARTVRKTYVALCHGNPREDRLTCQERIGRHPGRHNEMTTMRCAEEGRDAHTDFEVIERFAGDIFFVRAFPKTGRTHQIRVHLAKSGYPILADSVYGKESQLPEYHLFRQALHAQRLSLCHPMTGVLLSFEAPFPDDIQGALDVLRGKAI